MRISDWSSDVCSSDLGNVPAGRIHKKTLTPSARCPPPSRRSAGAPRSRPATGRCHPPNRAGGNRRNAHGRPDRKSVGKGKSVAGGVDLGGRRTPENKTHRNTQDSTERKDSETK